MTVPILKDRAGQIINKWQDWTDPRELYYWTEGRKEMELARAWFESNAFEDSAPQCPLKLQALFARNTHTACIEIDEGYSDFFTALPERGVSQHDLMLKAHTHKGSCIICITASVDEPFGKKIGDYWQEAKTYDEFDYFDEPPRAPERIQALLEIVFGTKAHPDQQPWCDLRYELLEAVAGTLLLAASEQVPLAVFAVHEFRMPLAKPESLKANAEDYARFVGALFSIRRTSNTQMYGPLRVQAGSHLPQSVELFVGKATTKCHRLFPGSIAEQMVTDGRSEELFYILLSEYKYLKKHRDNLPFHHLARSIDWKWVCSNSGSDENTKKRLRVIIERDIPDLWPFLWP